MRIVAPRTPSGTNTELCDCLVTVPNVLQTQEADMSALSEGTAYSSIDRSVGFETVDYIAYALALVMTLGPLAAGMLLWPIP